MVQKEWFVPLSHDSHDGEFTHGVWYPFKNSSTVASIKSGNPKNSAKTQNFPIKNDKMSSQ